MKAQHNTITSAIDGSRGTIVFGSGIHAMKVEVTHAGDDYVQCVPWDTEETIVVPMASIAYYRFALEDD